ncbi:hypothetical protein [Pseudoruegeria sp. HB172150]|uniref:hypothetical protein n=1 Tax=Pseudoruegeria sp. HB172150 TaxID=2721164 RepID=UPI0015551763|nr:hypothetical protein [Pseudoruegeria sp. HB172150]
MKSYETARKMFDILEIAAWLMVGAGVLLTLSGPATVSQFAPSGAAMAAALPGIAVAFLGMLQVAIVQNARAGVDTAEYTQQMLQVARDQLEVSRRGFKLQKGAPAAGFTEALSTDRDADPPVEGPSYADTASTMESQSEAAAAIEQSTEEAEKERPVSFEHRGHQVYGAVDGYYYDGQRFDTSEKAVEFIDRKDPLLAQQAKDPSRNAV